MRVLIADDHDLLRDVLHAYLLAEGEFEVTLAADVDEALSAVSATGAYDLVLLDYSMPGMDGLSGLEAMLAANAGKPVALMSGVASDELAMRALERGAAGFLPKRLPARSAVNAIRFMASGERFLPMSLMTRAEPAAPAPGKPALSPRERQVLEGLCAGKANKEIARDLDLREPTVKLHVKLVCRKLGARNRTHAAMIARESGLF